MRKLVHKVTQRHAVLQRNADRGGEGVYKSADCGSLFRHLQEDLARLAIFVETNGEVALLPTNVEAVRDRRALHWEASAGHTRTCEHVAAYRRLILLLAGAEWLRALRTIAVDRDRLQAELPPFQVDALNLRGGGSLWHVHRLGDCAGEERLCRRHHAHVAHVLDGTLAILRLEGAVEHREVLVLQAWRPLNGLLLVNVLDDRGNLRGVVAELGERFWDRLVDDLEEAFADELLVLDECDVWLNARGVAIHHEGDRPGRGEHTHLCVAIPVRRAELKRSIPRIRCRLGEILRQGCRWDLVRGVAVLADHAKEGLLVLLVLRERSAVCRRRLG